jgi:hypothetical protein
MYGPCSDGIFLPMRWIPMLLLCIVVLVAISYMVGCNNSGSQGARGPASHKKSDNVVLALRPERDSGVSGTAFLEEISEGVLVKLELDGLPKPNAFYLAHIHPGTCFQEEVAETHEHGEHAEEGHKHGEGSNIRSRR